MFKRIRLPAVALVAFTLLWLGTPRAASQLVDRKQALVINYPNPGIVISDARPVYKGTIYVKVYPAGSSGALTGDTPPLVAAELNPSQRSLSQLPQGEYEVHYAIRKGSELNTLIHRNVVLRADHAVSMTVEMNADAKTTIIGGDLTAQRMAESLRSLQAEVATLKQQLSELKRK